MSLRLSIPLIVALLEIPAPAAVIQGRIVEDHTNRPLASAEVRVYLQSGPGRIADLETDGEGRFQTPDLPESAYRLEMSKPNYMTASLQLTGVSSPVLARLIRLAAVTGQVLDREGQPVAGASVFAMPAASGRLTRVIKPGHFAPVDSRGQYRIYNLPPGQYAIALSYGASTTAVGGTGSAALTGALGSGFIIHRRTLNLLGGEEIRSMDFQIIPGALHSISGKVEVPALAKGTFWLALTSPDQPGVAVAVTQASVDGAFRFEGVPEGRYHLLASGPSTARGSQGAVLGEAPMFARANVDVIGQDVESVAIAPANGLSIAFALSEAACEASGKLTLTPLEDWAATLERTAAIGAETKRVKFTALAPARYVASVTGLSGKCYGLGSVVVDLSAEDKPEQVTIPVGPAASIRGSAGAGAAIMLLPLQSEPRPAQTAIADAESRFAFTGLPPGRYRIWMPSQPAREVELRGGEVVSVDF